MADDPKPLTADELKALRALILADARRQWAVSALKGVAVWIAAVAGGWLAFKTAMMEFFGT